MRPDSLPRAGITHTMDQVIEAPSIVKKVLADFCSINSSYIGDEYAHAREGV